MLIKTQLVRKGDCPSSCQMGIGPSRANCSKQINSEKPHIPVGIILNLQKAIYVPHTSIPGELVLRIDKIACPNPGQNRNCTLSNDKPYQ